MFPLERELAAPLPKVLRKPTAELPRLPVVTDWMPMLALSFSVTLEPMAKTAPPPVI